MNTEELTIVMDTLRSLGDDGKTAFIWWLVFDKLIPAIGGIVAVCVITFGLGRPAMSAFRSENYVRDLRDRFRIGTPGYVSDSELRQLKQRIDKLIRDDE